MSSRKEHTYNRKLKELLDKQKESGKGAEDAFEQEALEGFALLENEQEAQELQQKLDARVYKEVFTEGKKQKRLYWYAAAGLLLLVGFSIYFLRNSPLAKEKEKLAETSAASVQKDELKKDIQLQEQSVEKQEPALQAAPSEITADQKAKPSKQLPAVAQKPLAREKSEDQDAAKAMDQESEVIEENKAAVTPAITAADVTSPNVNVTGSSASMSSQDLSKSVALGASQDKVVIQQAPRQAKYEHAKKKQEAERLSVSAPAAIPVQGWEYEGGPEALDKKIRTQLSTKDLLQKFDANLTISKKGKVEAVVFTQSFALNEAQQKEIKEILMTLPKFHFKGEKAVSAEYKLSFRP